MTTATTVHDQYARTDLRNRIEHALRAAGKDPLQLTVDDLAPLDEFHLLGRPATLTLAKLAQIAAADRVLDLGAGIGGPARLLAHTTQAGITALDLTAEFCAIADWLNQATGLADRITVVQGDALALPLPDASFDVVWTQHVQMNIADKDRLYAEARRVLASGGRLALWDAVVGSVAPPRFPVPWADTPDRSHLVTAEQLREHLERAGFEVATWNDLTTEAIQFLTAIGSAPPGPLGLHVYVNDLPAKASTLLANLEEDRVRMLQAVLVGR